MKWTNSYNGKLLKLVNQFIYLSSNISSTESNVNKHREGMDNYQQVNNHMEILSPW